MKKTRSVLLYLVKVTITVSLIVVICTKINVSVLVRHLHSKGGIYFILGTLSLALNDIVVSARWWFILRRLNVRAISLGYAMVTTYAAVFMGQVAPGAIGVDAVRAWLCHKRGIKVRTILLSLVTDRLLALLGFVVVAATAWYGQFGMVDWRREGPIAVLAILATVGALWLMPVLASILAKRWQRLHVVNSLAVIFRFTVLSRAGVIGIALSCVVVALTVNAVMLFGLGLGVDIAPSVAFLVVPVAVIFSSLPISIGGWGVREASLSYGLTLFGKAPADAGMVGLALGIGLLLSSLPGGIAVLALGGSMRPTSRFNPTGEIDTEVAKR